MLQFGNCENATGPLVDAVFDALHKLKIDQFSCVNLFSNSVSSIDMTFSYMKGFVHPKMNRSLVLFQACCVVDFETSGMGLAYYAIVPGGSRAAVGARH